MDKELGAASASSKKENLKKQQQKKNRDVYTKVRVKEKRESALGSVK